MGEFLEFFETTSSNTNILMTFLVLLFLTIAFSLYHKIVGLSRVNTSANLLQIKLLACYLFLAFL